MEEQAFVGEVLELAESFNLSSPLYPKDIELSLVATRTRDIFPDEFTLRIAFFHSLNPRGNTLVDIVYRVELLLTPDSSQQQPRRELYLQE